MSLLVVVPNSIHWARLLGDVCQPQVASHLVFLVLMLPNVDWGLLVQGYMPRFGADASQM